MTTVNMHEAKSQLSRLVDAATRGEVITIAKAGVPVAQLIRVGAPSMPKRIGFLVGQARIPDNFDSVASEEIADLFEDKTR